MIENQKTREKEAEENLEKKQQENKLNILNDEFSQIKKEAKVEFEKKKEVNLIKYIIFQNIIKNE